jgi:hypothetical protein
MQMTTKMKNLIYLLLILPSAVLAQSGSVGIGTTTPNASAVLDIQSTEKGMLVPRMSTAQRNAIPTPAPGLLVFDNTTRSFWYRGGSNWIELVDTLNNVWKRNGSNIFTNFTNVGIGVSTLTTRLSVNGNMSLHNDDAVYGVFRRWNTVDMAINATGGNIVSGTDPGHLVLQISQPPFFMAGNVGIGTGTPATKLDVNGDIRASGKVNRTATGGANLVPVCYGKVNAAGNILSGTGNFTVNHIATGNFIIDIAGFNYVDIVDRGIVLVTPQTNSLTGIMGYYNTFINSSYQDFVVLLKDMNGYVDVNFSFIVYIPD